MPPSFGDAIGRLQRDGSFAHPVSHLASASTSVNTTEMPTGNYDVAYDIWFNQTAQASGQPNGTEVMIWINHNGTPQPYGTKTATETIDGRFLGGVDRCRGKQPFLECDLLCADSATSSVTNLALVPFFTDAVVAGKLARLLVPHRHRDGALRCGTAARAGSQQLLASATAK